MVGWWLRRADEVWAILCSAFDIFASSTLALDDEEYQSDGNDEDEDDDGDGDELDGVPDEATHDCSSTMMGYRLKSCRAEAELNTVSLAGYRL